MQNAINWRKLIEFQANAVSPCDRKWKKLPVSACLWNSMCSSLNVPFLHDISWKRPFGSVGFEFFCAFSHMWVFQCWAWVRRQQWKRLLPVVRAESQPGFTWSSTMENFDLASYSHVRDRGLMLLTDQPPWNYEVLGGGDNDILHLHEIGGYIRTTLSKQKSIVSYNYIMSICLLTQ